MKALPRRILIVDDNESIHHDIRKLLVGGTTDADLDRAAAALFGRDEPEAPVADYEIDSAYQGQEALELVTAAVRQGRPYELAFVDVRMPPGWDGIETVHHCWQVDADLQIVICTAFSDRSWDETVDILGHSDQFLVLKKPFDAIEVRQLAVALTEKWRLAQVARRHVERLEHAVCERTHEVVATRDLSVFALAKLAESRDSDTGAHLERMRGYAQLLAEQLRKEGPYRDQITQTFLDDLYRSTPLHDIGKVGIPDSILLKPGRLTPAEFEVMKTHSVIGAETLESALRSSGFGGFLAMAADIARYHHERWDGSGYPSGVRGEAIPLAARIVAVADVFDALTSARVYKTASPPEDARALIVEQSGRHFDPAVVAAFESAYEELLRLHSALAEQLPTHLSRVQHQPACPV